MIRLRVLASALMLVSASAWCLSLQEELSACRQLSDEAQRLSCYDKLVPVPPRPSPAIAPAPPEPQSFGAESLPPRKNEEPERLQARLAGKLDGWRKGTHFALDNGQVWVCIDDQEGTFELDRPAVTIGRGLGGGYWLHFEKVNAPVKVRRIR